MATFSNRINRRAATVQQQERSRTTTEINQAPIWYLREAIVSTLQDLGNASITVNTSASANLTLGLPLEASITVDLSGAGTLTKDENAATTYSGNVGNDIAINLKLSGIMDIEVPPADPESEFELIKLRGFIMNTPVIGSDGKPT